jgi:hypothetical protein
VTAVFVAGSGVTADGGAIGALAAGTPVATGDDA